MNIQINEKNAAADPHLRYKGQGMISCNGSSRLLMDYKAKNPQTYYQLLDYLFGSDGLELTHFKAELGSDVNTSSGTEPTTMRQENEKANVRRGAGFSLAADIKKRYPHVTLDMLWWSEPRWVTDAQDICAARWKWYKETLKAAYEVYGLEFDYVSANRNERAVDKEWIIYLSKALKNETDCPYDFSKIKVVAADECSSWNISGDMLRDPELLEAVDIVGSHYTSFADESTVRLAKEYGKEIWFSEGSSPMTHAPSTVRFDEGNSGLSGINGVLDIASRMIIMVKCGFMTMYEYQPAIAAYYDGVCYCQKQLINACTPWNGYFTLDSGFFMNLHFSRFIKKGWSYIYDACHAEGKAGGDGHSIVDGGLSFITACSDNGDYSTVLVNPTAKTEECQFNLSTSESGDRKVYVWETRGPDAGGSFDENYFKRIAEVIPENGSFKLEIKPYSLVTVTTLDIPEMDFTAPSDSENTVLPLPYTDNFSYTAEFIHERGGAPLYTTDQGGAFEVVSKEGRNVLMQQITPDIKADEWGATPEPTTSFGDDRWYNYTVSADVLTDGEGSYAGVGARYILASDGRSGYGAMLYHNGDWAFYIGNEKIRCGSLAAFDPQMWHNIRLTVRNNTAEIFIDEKIVLSHTMECAGCSAGRAALYSSYDHCCFANVRVEAIPDCPAYVQRLDDPDPAFSYSESGWKHDLMNGFKCYKRTLSTGSEGAYAEISFVGTGIILTGEQREQGVISVDLDGKMIESCLTLNEMLHRRVFFSIFGLDSQSHTLKLTVQKGECSLDEAQILS